MFKTSIITFSKLIATVLVLVNVSSLARADDRITIGEVTIRATVGNMSATGGYVTITNHGTESDRLVGVSAPFAKKSEIHMMEHVDGVMKMRAMANGAPIPAGSMLVLKPGGKHLMFMGLEDALAPNSMQTVTLQFEKAGAKTVRAHVKRPGDLKAMMDGKHSGHSDHGDHDGHDHHGDHKKKHDH